MDGEIHFLFHSTPFGTAGQQSYNFAQQITRELERVGVSRLITAISMQSEIFCSILNKEAEETEMHRVGSE